MTTHSLAATLVYFEFVIMAIQSLSPDSELFVVMTGLLHIFTVMVIITTCSLEGVLRRRCEKCDSCFVELAMFSTVVFPHVLTYTVGLMFPCLVQNWGVRCTDKNKKLIISQLFRCIFRRGFKLPTQLIWQSTDEDSDRHRCHRTYI